MLTGTKREALQFFVMASKVTVKTDFPGVESTVEGGKYFTGYSYEVVRSLHNFETNLSAGAHDYSLAVLRVLWFQLEQQCKM